MHQGVVWGPSLATCFLDLVASLALEPHGAVHANHHCVIHALHQEAYAALSQHQIPACCRLLSTIVLSTKATQ